MRYRQPFTLLLVMLLASCGGSSTPVDSSSTSNNISLSSTSTSESGSQITTSQTTSNVSSSQTSASSTSISLPAFTVTFVTNAATTLAPITTSVVDVPPTLSNDPYVLEGWYLDAGFTQIVSFPYVVTAPVTLYAKWIEGTPGFNFQINAASNGYIVDSYGGNLTQVAIPVSYQGLPVVELGDYLFYENGAITAVSLPSSLKVIGYASFKNATGITSIAIPNSVTTIANDAFAGASNLSNVTFSTNLQSIGNNAFENTNLTSITLPSSLVEINARSFAGNSLLQSVTLLATTPPIRFPNSFESCHVNLTFKVPSQALSAYQQHADWQPYTSIITTI